jgi:hypothetical protein
MKESAVELNVCIISLGLFAKRLEEKSERMGKRKSRKKPPQKVKSVVPLETHFDCPFCNHEKTCEVKM